jgi:argininosuccinate lyase
VVFDEATITSKVNTDIHAADQAYDLALRKGIPFREAYKEVAKDLKGG